MDSTDSTSRAKLSQIKDRKTCIAVLNYLKGVFMVGDWDFVLFEPKPSWAKFSASIKDEDRNPVLLDEDKEFKDELKKWTTANRKCCGYFLQYLNKEDTDHCEDLTAFETDLYL